MSTGKPLLVSYYRLKEPEDGGSQDSSDSDGSNMEPKYKFYIRYNPKDFSVLSIKDRNRILVNIFLKSGADKPLENSGSTSPISPFQDTSSSSPRALKTESVSTESPLKTLSESEHSSKASSPRFSKRGSSPRELLQSSPKRVLLPLEVRQPSPKRVLLPRETRQRSPKCLKAVEQEVPMGRQRRTASTQGNNSKPRWQRHDMIVYIALCNIPGQVACRAELLKAAIDLDRKISKEKGIPHVFKGKTPHNSASACLTMNKDNLFKRIHVPGQTRQYFGLAYPTGNFDLAVQRYRQWEEKLYRVLYPISFASEDSDDESSDGMFDDDKAASAEEVHNPSMENTCDVFPESSEASSKDDEASQSELASSGDLDEKPSTTASKTLPTPSKRALGKIPTSWKDILEVRASSIPGAGMGLFAKAFIPADTTIGYYFGTPLTEYDFDRTKDKVGLASHYSIMYQYMVLDATDENGMPFTDPDGPIFCPFHFMNEDKNRVNAAFHEGIEYNQISCHTLVDIFPGQELFVYYGTEFERDHYNI